MTNPTHISWSYDQIDKIYKCFFFLFVHFHNIFDFIKIKTIWFVVFYTQKNNNNNVKLGKKKGDFILQYSQSRCDFGKMY